MNINSTWKNEYLKRVNKSVKTKIKERRLDSIDVRHYKTSIIKSIRNYYKEDKNEGNRIKNLDIVSGMYENLINDKRSNTIQ